MNIDLKYYYDKYNLCYNSPSQLTRVITENWFRDNMYCPFCNNEHVTEFPNNYPVADFYCDSCKEAFQLKSKKGSIGRVITDGEYNKMIEAISSNNAPNFLFLNYEAGFHSIKCGVGSGIYSIMPDYKPSDEWYEEVISILKEIFKKK